MVDVIICAVIVLLASVAVIKLRKNGCGCCGRCGKKCCNGKNRQQEEPKAEE